MSNTSRLITVTIEDMSHGYQIAQTAHAVAQFAAEEPNIFKEWHSTSGFLICLAVPELSDLDRLKEILKMKMVRYVEFFEPDVNQITGIAIEPCEEADEITQYLSLAGRKSGHFSKYTV